MGEKTLQKQPTVLVADDEEIYVTITTNMLERSGARVLSASDGLEAVQQYEQHKEEISIVFLDLEMPRLDGVETFRRLKMLSPDVRVVIISGYVTPANRLMLNSLGPLGYIDKPMKMNDFLPYLTTRVQQNDSIAQDLVFRGKKDAPISTSKPNPGLGGAVQGISETIHFVSQDS